VSDSELVVVGRVGGPHGVAGTVRITSSTQPPENIEHYRPWLVGEGDRFRELEVVWLKPHGAGYVACFAGVTDRDQAQILSGLLIAVPRSVLPELEAGREYYWRDLIGMTVTDAADNVLGKVRRLLETGAHDVLVISDGEREVLVPFIEPFVLDVDQAARRIRVEWQEPA
jgi:16S rRNA processing protein RimM